MNFRIYLGAEAPSFIFVSLPGSAFYTIMKKCQFLSEQKLLAHIWHFFVCIVDVRNVFLIGFLFLHFMCMLFAQIMTD